MDLHIKYRPQSLSEVVGQSHIVDSMKVVLEKRSSHAFLLTGPSGVGKTTLARIASVMLGCKKINLIEVDAATNSGVENMRSLAEIASLDSIVDGGKAIIIDECHSLSKQAWQSILKSTEEPKENVFWFFCTTEAGKVPSTIRTRTTVYDCKPIRADIIHGRLAEVVAAEKMKVPDKVLSVVAQSAMGSMRAALVGLAQVDGITEVEKAHVALQLVAADKEVIGFLRYLCKKQINWGDAMEMLDSLGDIDPESLRISAVNYLTVVVRKNRDDNQICRLLSVIAAFSSSYDRSTSKAGIILSIGQITYSN